MQRLPNQNDPKRRSGWQPAVIAPRHRHPAPPPGQSLVQARYAVPGSAAGACVAQGSITVAASRHARGQGHHGHYGEAGAARQVISLKSWVGEESTMPWVLILSRPFLARCIILGLSSSRFPSRISRRSFGIIPNPPTTYSAAGRWREKMRSSKSRPSRRQASAV
jgi:hypothetical protein